MEYTEYQKQIAALLVKRLKVKSEHADTFVDRLDRVTDLCYGFGLEPKKAADSLLATVVEMIAIGDLVQRAV